MRDNEISELAQQVVKLIREAEGAKEGACLRKKVYLLFSGAWTNRFYLLLDEAYDMKELECCAVVPAGWENTPGLSKLKEYSDRIRVIGQNEADDISGDYITVFPGFGRGLAVKAALCIDDTFETAWIRTALEQGQKIVILKSGLERFTGREPNAYVKTILGYYKTLLEYEIELADSLEQVVMKNKLGKCGLTDE